MLEHWIWLTTRKALSDRKKLALLQQFQSVEAIFDADSHGFDAMEILSPEAKVSLADKSLENARSILDVCQRKRIRVMTYQDAAYPIKLKNIPDPPLVLYEKGQLPQMDALPTVGVVGTRKASAYGLTTAKRISYQIARCGGIVISGLASGIDTMAISGALTQGSPAVGVLGCGVDVVYPRSNRSLFADMEQYGCLLSEFTPGTAPLPVNFPRRNRIISGLSDGVLVVEAPENSGSLITARRALDQGRDVFVVPGNLDLDSFVGSNRLLRDGGTLAGCGWDILKEYEARYPDKVHRDAALCDEKSPPLGAPKKNGNPQTKVAQIPVFPTADALPGKQSNKKDIDKQASGAYSDLNSILPKLSEQERTLVLTLQGGEQLVDDVIAQTGMTTGKVLALMTMLELKGIVKRLPGKRISLK